jgi:hypothetical protein
VLVDRGPDADARVVDEEVEAAEALAVAGDDACTASSSATFAATCSTSAPRARRSFAARSSLSGLRAVSVTPSPSSMSASASASPMHPRLP